ncbi:MAG: UDP-4-amino-4,6-dideoxy-N-acetyl-beta-L-altrosamine transaminase [Desulfobacter sp.]
MPDTEKSSILPYGRQLIDQTDRDAVADVLGDPFLTTGPKIAEFEAGLCRVTGARHAVACANGTAALHLACMALGISNRDLGVTSPNSFLASANCVEFCGATADFIDIDPATLCMSPEKLDAYCRDVAVPRVVIPVSFAGLAADLPAIKALSETYGFAVIEDAAHALGSEYRSNGTSYACGSCSHSDLAIFSFHPVKTVTSGEGGAVMTNDDVLAGHLRCLRNHGMAPPCKTPGSMEHGAWYYEMHGLGYNYRLTDIQAALGLSQLEKLLEFCARRRQIVAMYHKAFAGSKELLILPHEHLATRACPHLYPIQFKGGAQIRQQVYEALKKENIFTQVHYIPIYWQPYYAEKYRYARGKCPAAETYYSRCLSLPLFPAMSDSDVGRVVDRVLCHVKGR